MAKRSARFWDRIALRYARKPVTDEAAYQHKLEVTRRYLRPDSMVLEIGCGTGSTAISHAGYVKHVHATDISSKMIEIAREKAGRESLENISFQQSPIEDLDIPDQTIDAVLALSLLHLVEDTQVVIARVYKMLKPGGVFVSSTACIRDKMPWFKFIGPAGRILGLMPLVKVFTATELLNDFIAAGFEIDYEWRPEKDMTLFVVARKA